MKTQTIDGSRLRRIREEKGLTQNELARLCGITHSNVSRMESGHRQPSGKTFNLFCEHLGVSRESLLAYEDEALASDDLAPEGWEALDPETQRIFTVTMAEGPGVSLHEKVDVWATWAKGRGISITVDMPTSAPQFTFQEIKRMHADMGAFIQQIEGALR